MLLYHGSDGEVSAPRILQVKRALDFGAGFYTTLDYDQACKWATNVCSRRGAQTPVVSVFELDESCFDWLDVLRFESADRDWLEFVTSNRKQSYAGRTHDVVIGPVANDRTMIVLTLYFNGLLSEGEAIERLMTQRLADQHAFKTGRAVRQLVFREAIAL